MNWLISKLADEKELPGAVQNETIMSRREQEQEVLQGKAGWLLQGYSPLGDGRALSGRFPHSANQVLPDGLVSDSYFRASHTAVRLSWFGVLA